MLASAWAVLGISLLFGFAVARLAARGLETVAAGLTPLQWTLLSLLTLLFVYGEGVMALQRQWIPRVLRRTAALRTESSTLLQILAPLYAMGLVDRSRRTTVRSWAGTGGIVAAVILVRQFPAPWRGITSLAVSAALAWALGVLVFRGPRYLLDPGPTGG